LILWHGWADHSIYPSSTIAYYERVVDTVGGQSAADAFVRLYTSPGVDHLNTGVGPGTTDFLAALDAWVEDGTAPGDLVSFKLDPRSGDPVLSRPLCRHPNYARYTGSGDPNLADSFACVAP
jgi:feruloyl esterase